MCVYDVAGYHCKECKCVMNNKGLQKPPTFKKKTYYSLRIIFRKKYIISISITVQNCAKDLYKTIQFIWYNGNLVVSIGIFVT